MRELTVLTVIAVVEGGFFEIDFPSHIEVHNPVLMILKIRAKHNKPKTRGQKVD